jgi:hypothetical protein
VKWLLKLLTNVDASLLFVKHDLNQHVLENVVNFFAQEQTKKPTVLSSNVSALEPVQRGFLLNLLKARNRKNAVIRFVANPPQQPLLQQLRLPPLPHRQQQPQRHNAHSVLTTTSKQEKSVRTGLIPQTSASPTPVTNSPTSALHLLLKKSALNHLKRVRANTFKPSKTKINVVHLIQSFHVSCATKTRKNQAALLLKNQLVANVNHSKSDALPKEQSVVAQLNISAYLVLVPLLKHHPARTARKLLKLLMIVAVRSINAKPFLRNHLVLNTVSVVNS